MGSGKTTIGKRLAEVLSYPFFDLDEIIERKVGRNINEIFEFWGEKVFRNIETEALKEIVNKNKFVLSCGGGIVEREENMKTIKYANGIILWLDISFDFFIKRLPGLKHNRPLLRNGLDRIKDLYERRKILYKNYSNYSILVNGKTPDELVKEILCLLRLNYPE